MSELSYEQLCEMFDECFDDGIPAVVFGGLAYQPSRVLKSVDPIAYREEVINYIDSLLTDEQIYEHADGTYHDEPEQVENLVMQPYELKYVITELTEELWGTVYGTLIDGMLKDYGEVEITEDEYGCIIDVRKVEGE